MTIKPKHGNTTLTPTLSSLFKVDMKNTYQRPGNFRPYIHHFLKRGAVFNNKVCIEVEKAYVDKWNRVWESQKAV